MRNLNKVFLTILICSTSVMSFAQEKGQFNASATYVFGAGIAANGGINMGIEYFISPKITAAPSYTHYFSSGIKYGEFNVDARYYFLWGHVQLYGIAGYTNLNVNGNFPIFGDVDESESGYNVGAGIYFPSGNRLFFTAQIKYASTLDGQAYYQAGVAYKFN
jgi:Outer membrane protein beta-barrel domain